MSDGIGNGGRGMRLWTLQAERDRMHPAAIGYVHGDAGRHGPVPGAWDAVSDLLGAGVRARSPRVAAVLGGACRADPFARFADAVACLPDPAAVLDPAVRARVAIEDPGVAFAHVVRLVRHACGIGGPEGEAALDRLCAYAVDNLSPSLGTWVGDLVEGPHGLALPELSPGGVLYLGALRPERAESLSRRA